MIQIKKYLNKMIYEFQKSPTNKKSALAWETINISFAQCQYHIWSSAIVDEVYPRRGYC